jgi:putative CocE/NonD family hydrolase
MKTIADFPRQIVEFPDMGIVMPDGCRLSARVWMPADADQDPVPAILEHLPYRKRDGTTARDALTHPYFAGHGYACLRVDMRGNGDSEGLMEDEYTEQELQDACDVIAWAAGQPWCNGKVGMMGISWGGFNALQVAAKQPPALKAIITLCSTDDRYADDIHYKGGLLLNENMGWGATMLSYSSRPPDPAVVGDRWRDMWLERLESEPFLPAVWLRRQTRDAYWKRGSVCEDFSRIKAATLAVGGWGDGYKNAVSRLVQGIDAPVKGIVGPWIHKYPHFAVPKPAIGFLQEGLRWWDRWLKDIGTGVEQDPAMRLYVMDSEPPRDWYEERPGRWIAERSWPSPDIAMKRFQLACRGCGLDRTGLDKLATGLRHGRRRILRDLARPGTAWRPTHRRRKLALFRYAATRRTARHRRRPRHQAFALGEPAQGHGRGQALRRPA